MKTTTHFNETIKAYLIKTSKKSHKKIIFDIQSKNGRDIGEISEFNGIFNPKNQREVLFDKGAKYYVSPKIIEKDGYYYIKLIER